MNAHTERFNRTIQASFVDDHEDFRKLADWLVVSNAQRPTIPSASNPRSLSSCNINPSAKGTGPIQRLDKGFRARILDADAA
ncbi:MAG: hypothetical protein HXY19_04600 [Thermoanaerobaculaceae bacterium]|nr:hypothetical protein [Thermoanaerobaculaceae bacterium]